MPAEIIPPVGQAAFWYDDVIQHVPRSGQRVARQIARLCGSDSHLSLFIWLVREFRALERLEDGLLIGGDGRREGVRRAVDRDSR